MIVVHTGHAADYCFPLLPFQFQTFWHGTVFKNQFFHIPPQNIRSRLSHSRASSIQITEQLMRGGGGCCVFQKSVWPGLIGPGFIARKQGHLSPYSSMEHKCTSESRQPWRPRTSQHRAHVHCCYITHTSCR